MINSKMAKYLIVDLIEAEEFTNNFNTKVVKIKDFLGNKTVLIEKEEFDKKAIKINDSNKINEDIINNFINKIDVEDYNNKVTISKAEFKSGFLEIANSACVDSNNYDTKIGQDINLKLIKDKLWAYLGFVLQWGIFGLKEKEDKLNKFLEDKEILLAIEKDIKVILKKFILKPANNEALDLLNFKIKTLLESKLPSTFTIKRIQHGYYMDTIKFEIVFVDNETKVERVLTAEIV